MSTSSPNTGGHGESMHVHEGSLKGYLTGFVLAAILTVIPFWLVMDRVIADTRLLIFVILVLAAIQIFVHVFFFLHLDTRSESGWNILAFLFTAVLVIIVLGASIWSMYQENANMMPGMMQTHHQPQATPQQPPEP